MLKVLFENVPKISSHFQFHPILEPHLSVRWINEDNKLIADSQNPTYELSNRILYPNGSLAVVDVKLNDTGDYICEVNIGNNRVIKQINSIEVQGEH